MIDEKDLGPPRIVRGIDAYCKEVDRQRALVNSGDLRRYHFSTWGWCKRQTGEWRWLSTYSTTAGGAWVSRGDREAAWNALIKELNQYD